WCSPSPNTTSHGCIRKHLCQVLRNSSGNLATFTAMSRRLAEPRNRQRGVIRRRTAKPPGLGRLPTALPSSPIQFAVFLVRHPLGIGTENSRQGDSQPDSAILLVTNLKCRARGPLASIALRIQLSQRFEPA